ncbi:CLUMA_CG000656, isoform A [Clunio marinus]|uniref:CLUMA_CG000656, isoform A n=1 Tax=Clunio marinus TaxID=568069 RepID=A0A1J1HG35_9DIPT|nr:CLUMA_CG000656, isoform A [Clunio marinus]
MFGIISTSDILMVFLINAQIQKALILYYVECDSSSEMKSFMFRIIFIAFPVKNLSFDSLLAASMTDFFKGSHRSRNSPDER